MSDEPLLQPGSVQNERYRIVALLARGGFGEVYEALDVHMGRRVALKYIFQPLDLNHLHNEVQILAAHAEELRFMPIVYDYWRGRRGVGFFIVMEFIPGPTLDQSKPFPWPAEQVITFVRTLLGDLRDLHRRGIIHCDIKPVNIKATPARDLSSPIPFKLLDFGIAQRHERTALAAASPHFAAPEQHGLGASSVDPRADLYALGATAYYLLTGQKPLDARERYAGYTRGAPDGLVPLTTIAPGVPPGLAATIAELMQLDRERRPADAAAALALLERRLAAPPPEPLRADETELEALQERAPTALSPRTADTPQQVLLPARAERRPATALGERPPLPARAAAQLDQHGHGPIAGITWEHSGEALLVATTLGVYRFELASGGCTPWHSTGTPVRSLGTIGSSAVLVAAGLELRRLPREGGEPSVVQTIAATAHMVSARHRELLAILDDDALHTLSLADPQAATTWNLQPRLAGRVLALAADGGTALIAEDGQMTALHLPGARRRGVQSVRGLAPPLTDAALSNDGSLAVAAGGGALYIWEPGSEAAHTLSHPGAAAVAITGDGELLAVADAEGVALRRAYDGRGLPPLGEADMAGVHRLAFCPRDRLLAAASSNELRVWQLDGGPATRCSSFGRAATWLAPLPGEGFVALGSRLERWAIEGDRLLAGPSGPALPQARDLAAGGGWIAWAQGDAVFVCPGAAPEDARRITMAPAQTHGLAITLEGDRLVVVGADSLVSLHLPTGDEQLRLPLGSDVEHVALAPRGELAALHRRGLVTLHTTGDGAEVCALRPRGGGEITALALTAEGGQLAVAQGRTLLLYRLAGGRAQLIGQQTAGDPAPHHLAFAADGRTLVSLQGALAHIWALSDGTIAPEPLRCAHNDRVLDALILGDHLITSSLDGALRLWATG